MKKIFLSATLAFCTIFISACTKNSDITETEVRAFAARTESYSNQKNIPEIEKQLSADFKLTINNTSDSSGQNVSLDKNGYVQLLNATLPMASEYKFSQEITNIVINKDTARVTAKTTDSITIGGETTTSTGSTVSNLKKVDGTLLISSAEVEVTAQ